MGNDQEKQEKVIKGLEHELRNRGKCGHYCREGIETFLCEYDKDGFCIQHWGKDALALLKAQEPVEPTIGGDADGPCGNWWYQCGKCKEAIDYHDRYCRNCGQAVKWE